MLQANCSASVCRGITMNHSNSMCSWGFWSLNYLQSNSLRISLVFSAISHLFSTMSVGISLLLSEGSQGCLCDLHRARIVSRAQSILADPNHHLSEHLRPLPSGRRFVVLRCGASRCKNSHSSCHCPVKSLQVGLVDGCHVYFYVYCWQRDWLLFRYK